MIIRDIMSNHFNIQCVPIPIVKLHCTKACCMREYMPLQVAYARTIHKYQGLSAGPVDVGQIPNQFDVIICDPDSKRAEGNHPGLFYTALSRATTLGDDDGGNSATYFDGEHYNEARIRTLTKKTDSYDDYEKIIKRNKWVKRIQNNTVKGLATVLDTNKQNNLTWAANTRIHPNVLLDRIDKYKRECTIHHKSPKRKRK